MRSPPPRWNDSNPRAMGGEQLGRGNRRLLRKARATASGKRKAPPRAADGRRPTAAPATDSGLTDPPGLPVLGRSPGTGRDGRVEYHSGSGRRTRDTVDALE